MKKVYVYVLTRLGRLGAAIRAEGQSPIRFLVGTGTAPAHGLLCELEAALGAISLLKSPCNVYVIMNSGIASKIPAIMENASGNLASIKELYVEASSMHSISFTYNKDVPEKLLLSRIIETTDENDFLDMRYPDMETAKEKILGKAVQDAGFWGLFVSFNDYNQPEYNLLCAWAGRPLSNEIAQVSQLRDLSHFDSQDAFMAACDVLASGASFQDGRPHGNHKFFIKRIAFGCELFAGRP